MFFLWGQVPWKQRSSLINITSENSARTLIYGFTEFTRGSTNTDDDEPSVRPRGTVKRENIKKDHKILLTNRKMKICKNQKPLKGFVHTILHNHLDIRTPSSLWVPCFHIVDQKNAIYNTR